MSTPAEALRKIGVKFDRSQKLTAKLLNGTTLIQVQGGEVELLAPKEYIFSVYRDSETDKVHIIVGTFKNSKKWNDILFTEGGDTLEQCLKKIEDSGIEVGDVSIAAPADDIPYLLPFLDRDVVEESYPYRLLLKQKEVLEQQTEGLVKTILLVYQSGESTFISFCFFDAYEDMSTLVSIELKPNSTPYPLIVSSSDYSMPDNGEIKVNNAEELKEAVKLALNYCVEDYWRSYIQAKESYESRK